MTDPLPIPELLRQELAEVLMTKSAKEILPYVIIANETVTILLSPNAIDL
jgi:hypothetical protein